MRGCDSAGAGECVGEGVQRMLHDGTRGRKVLHQFVLMQLLVTDKDGVDKRDADAAADVTHEVE